MCFRKPALLLAALVSFPAFSASIDHAVLGIENAQIHSVTCTQSEPEEQSSDPDAPSIHVPALLHIEATIEGDYLDPRTDRSTHVTQAEFRGVNLEGADQGEIKEAFALCKDLEKARDSGEKIAIFVDVKTRAPLFIGRSR